MLTLVAPIKFPLRRYLSILFMSNKFCVALRTWDINVQAWGDACILFSSIEPTQVPSLSLLSVGVVFHGCINIFGEHFYPTKKATVILCKNA